MNFFLDMIPPTVTAQEHKVMIRRGRPVFYDTPRLKEARRLYEHALRLNRPETPLEGALALTVEWYFPSKTHREGALRVTRPDTDNLQKLWLMNIHRIDSVIIDDRAKSWAGKCDFCMWIFSL